MNQYLKITKFVALKSIAIALFYFFTSLIVETAPFCSLLASTKLVPDFVMNQVKFNRCKLVFPGGKLAWIVIADLSLFQVPFTVVVDLMASTEPSLRNWNSYPLNSGFTSTAATVKTSTIHLPLVMMVTIKSSATVSCTCCFAFSQDANVSRMIAINNVSNDLFRFFIPLGSLC